MLSPGKLADIWLAVILVLITVCESQCDWIAPPYEDLLAEFVRNLQSLGTINGRRLESARSVTPNPFSYKSDSDAINFANNAGLP